MALYLHACWLLAAAVQAAAVFLEVGSAQVEVAEQL
jgi:hypothetical protein